METSLERDVNADENILGTQEGEGSSARSIHVTKEGESVLERGQWEGTRGTLLWWVYTVLSEDGAEITGEPTGARSDPNLHASWHIHHLSAMLCLLC